MSLNKMDRIDCRINLNVKILSKEVCKDLGMSLTEAINLFLHQMIIHHGLPFQVKMTAQDRKLFILPDEYLEKCVSEGHYLDEKEMSMENTIGEDRLVSEASIPMIEENKLSPEEDPMDEELLQ